jgi:hypothetical protein
MPFPSYADVLGCPELAQDNCHPKYDWKIGQHCGYSQYCFLLHYDYITLPSSYSSEEVVIDDGFIQRIAKIEQ